ncbi:hypothetical protein Poli38472_009063 [Pythium oligandrum]|uniref:Uncharacterized protein n=1 Tax=Pythium oligandrum TaxID=41045 RepID=A0A8K1CJR4_PYTOL|nr:hypothetical protein Poli38472_009063 [Pythium oligandrum]|eukprot:TMW64896.1 hypothetical protein Poli38472_009063 [Pythium oligandrum]
MSGGDDEGDSPAKTSARSRSSSTDLSDGRPEPILSRVLPRPKSVWKRQKSVVPFRIEAGPDDLDDGIIFLNNPAPFDFRSIFQRAKSVPTLQKQTAFVNGGDNNGKRYLRSHEELCLVMHKPLPRGGTSKKAWFLTRGFVGRESGENVQIVTKDASMASVHAEVTIDGDDYLLRDCDTSAGTYVCLSTTNRHQPQRDGFRLRTGDTFILGSGSRIVVNALTTVPRPKSEHPSGRRVSTQSRLERRLTDTSDMTPANHRLLRKKSSRFDVVKKSVRFTDLLDKSTKPPEEYSPMLPADDGGNYPAGVRYKRAKKLPQPVYPDLLPTLLEVTVTTVEHPESPTKVTLGAKTTYTIGSSPWCDIHVASEGIYGVHARIVFDGHFFVLQDLSFEENPRRKTRVLLSRATRIGRGDCLLFGKCAVHVVSVSRAFRDHNPDLKEVAFKCQVLRPSKRKSRRRDKYLPVAFKHNHSETFTIGKGGNCDGQIFTAALCVEQFWIQLDHGQCSLTPRFAGINQGMYFLLGRNPLPHEAKYKDDIIRYTSKALMLVEGSVFKIGNCEYEVAYVKVEESVDAMARADEIRENTQLLMALPWLQQITFDRHGLENVAKRAQRLELAEGESVYDEGDPASFFFIVIKGTVELVSTQKNRRSSLPKSGSAGVMTIAPLLGISSEPELLVETVGTGGYFGERSLWAVDLEYADSARAATVCQLLVLSREDLCGYFSYYMDIIRPHLAYETHKDLLHRLRLYVSWCEDISYQELRVMAARAERIYFQQDDRILHQGALYHQNRQRYGLLLLRHGAVDVVDADGTCILTDPKTSVSESLEMSPRASRVESETGASDGFDVQESPGAGEQQAWHMDEAILLLPNGQTAPPSANTVSFENLRARTGVQCFFIDVSVFRHLLKQDEERHQTGVPLIRRATGSAHPPILRRQSTNRRSTYAVPFKARHSQVFTTALRDNNTNDDGDNLLENAELEDQNDTTKKWRRKKRNKNLLEKTILETQQNTELLNALVLYALSGANRGDIHVVRNVATIGGLLSGADIELNDRYVSPQQAVIEHREGRYWLYDTFSDWGTYVRLEENQSVQIYPGDVFLAGEVEFTCMGVFPERKKSALCCLQ